MHVWRVLIKLSPLLNSLHGYQCEIQRTTCEAFWRAKCWWFRSRAKMSKRANHKTVSVYNQHCIISSVFIDFHSYCSLMPGNMNWSDILSASQKDYEWTQLELCFCKFSKPPPPTRLLNRDPYYFIIIKFLYARAKALYIKFCLLLKILIFFWLTENVVTCTYNSKPVFLTARKYNLLYSRFVFD